jgi:hypothetical protein
MRAIHIGVWPALAIAALAVQAAPAVPKPVEYGSVRMAFEPNRGQSGTGVHYLSRGRGYTLLLRDTEAVLALTRGETDAAGVAFRWMNTATPQVRAERPTGGVSNYFTDAFRGTNIPHFSQVRQAGIYRGIDVVYYGTDAELEYDVVVKPGGNPSEPRFRIEGAHSVALRNGELHIGLAGRQIVQRRPVVYQMKAGRRQPVSGEYVLLAKNEVGFRVGAYDRSRELVIDPVVAYKVTRGAPGTAVDEATSVAVDAIGSAYVAGYTRLSTFPVVNAAQPTYGGGDADAFVMKISPAGDQVMYATFLGGPGTDIARGIAVDNLGNAYVVGETSATMPVTHLRTTSKGSVEGFLFKLNAAGNQIAYGTYLGGSFDDRARAVAVDAARNAYVTGWTTSTDFNDVTRSNSTTDAFLVKVNEAATTMSTVFRGGNAADLAYAIALDASGNIYIGGDTASTDLTGLAFQTSKRGPAGVNDGFVARFDSSLAPVYWGYIGGDAQDAVRGLAVDNAGSVYVAGQAGSKTNFPMLGGFSVASAGIDAFVAKINSAGTLVYSAVIGGDQEDVAFGVAVDAAGSAHISGATISTNFPAVGTQIKTTPPGSTYDIFAARFNAAGSALFHSVRLGGSQSEVPQGMAIDPAGSVYIVGSSLSPEVIPAGSQQDAVVYKLATGCTFTVTPASASLTSAAQVLTLTVTTASDCTWTASTTSGFLAVTAGTSGIGTGTVSVSVQANGGTAARTGSVTVAGQTIAVSQAGTGSASCTYILSSTANNVTAAGIESSFTLTTGASCTWSAISSASWLQVFPISGTGGTTLFYTVYPNFTPSARSATLNIGGQTFTVNQAGNALNADQRFVQLLYFSFFGRLPTTAELDFQVNTGLGTAKDYAGLALGFLNSTEFNVGGRFVAGLYVGLLDRNAEFGGWQFQRNAFARNIVDQATLVTNFLGSPEYAARFGNPTDTQFVELLYTYVLLRPGSPAEIAFQASQLQPTGPLTRTQLAMNFLNSTEFRQGTGARLTAFLLYATMLLRDPTPAEMSLRMSQLSGATQDTIKALLGEIIATPEFRAVVGW